MSIAQKQRRWARFVGAALILAFGVAAYQSMAFNVANARALARPEDLTGFFVGVLALEGVMLTLTLFIAFGFLPVLRPVNGPLAILATAGRLVGAGFTAYGIFLVARLLPQVSQGNMVELTERYGAFSFDIFHYGLIASSFGALLTFVLLFAGRLVPRVISGFGILASLGVIVAASSIYLAPPLSDLMYPWYVGANALAYVALMVWLLVMSVDAAEPEVG